MSVIYQPVWQRHAYDPRPDMGTPTDPVRFRVRVADTAAGLDALGGDVIYEGAASVTPGTSSCEISINDIAAAYLAAPYKAPSGDFTTQKLGRYFALDVYDTGAWTEMERIFFYDNWSYDYDFNYKTNGLAHPVTGVAQDNMWLVASLIDWDDEQGADWLVDFEDGTSTTISVELHRVADFNNDFNDDFAWAAGDYGVAGYAALDLSALASAHPVRARLMYIGEGGADVVLADYKIVPACKRYALYYRNAYGGMDVLLVDGAVRTETYARATIGRWADNAIPGVRQVENYRNGVTEGWTLRVNNLTDEAASRMHHLLGSPEVYLCDTIADTLTPLVLTSNECEDKTFANGRKRNDYKFTASTAQDRRRE